MPDLPDAVLQYPACGVCGAETAYSDGFVCYDCQLTFDEATLAASFLDPDVAVCGAACDNFWHGDHKIKPGWGFRCDTCQLPATHNGMHWTDCLNAPVPTPSGLDEFHPDTTHWKPE